MPILLEYLLKLSISLAMLYIFYRAVLRPLTFYQCNRFYLAGYVLLSFIIPFINIDPWISSEGSGGNQLIGFIPAIGTYTLANTTILQQPAIIERLTLSDWIIIFFSIGAIVMLARLVVQYISLRRIRSKAVLLEKASGVMVYETNAPVSPFSFGSSVYFNRNMQSEEELERIIQHEFVHVKQKHTIDLVIGELLCIVNWYNPFAWLIRHAIRQNLEFIADNNVLENGLDRKEYQYLLLKVMGVPRFSIANNFNFSNLKKRIAMMNKMKSTSVHLTKFLFVLPLLMVILVAFRNREIKEAMNSVTGITVFADTVPRATPPPVIVDEVVEVRGYKRQDVPYNSKGYRITIADNDGECVVVVKDRNKKIVKAVALNDWDAALEATYGKIPPPPPPPPVIEVPGKVMSAEKLKKGVSALYVNGYKAEIVLSNGMVEKFDLSVPAERVAFEKKYGNIPRFEPPAIIKVEGMLVPPAKKSPPTSPTPVEITGVNLSRLDSKLYVIDGVVQPKDVLEAIAPNDITKVDVLKGETATALYGEKGRNGVVSITTKSGTVVPLAGATGRPTHPFPDSARRYLNMPQIDNVLIIVDDKEYAPGTFEINSIKGEDIKAISVFKDENAVKIYGDKGKNGVIIITTKNAKTAVPVTAVPSQASANPDEVIVVGYGTKKKQVTTAPSTTSAKPDEVIVVGYGTKKKQ
jgi:TonB-dependent SusC/RagA subfamily outer membrane receptor